MTEEKSALIQDKSYSGSVENDDSPQLGQLEPMAFGLHIGRKHISEFLKLKKRLQLGNSTTIHEAVRLANKHLDMLGEAKIMYIIPQRFIERE